MGYGSYSHSAHEALLHDRASLPTQEVFQQRACHALMNPKGVQSRESCDSDDHPNSVGIVFALDVTGSMGDIPKRLATKELPNFMKLLTDCRVQDPQLLFMAVGDATSDRAPLQVGLADPLAGGDAPMRPPGPGRRRSACGGLGPGEPTGLRAGEVTACPTGPGAPPSR